ncbi:MAG: D-glycero-beta-D-manno-heptose-1,7-bisphosphate 7-phosphatase [Gammaproteobacteria bacterium CG_4_10_14_0_8_um_filter_38_16]|nr:MAG: D-glycero-beta-D-manno-heptose-1,7-bisphosphate 7-phosphatase [Gammaproteobacteria bacterium CG_4_10_14_0_8_um_filter_38_16]PJA03677.1 MAG: D-glycero-beta-D-manno-heptose-1,7-bisphosphate 7-phosphatase [Gammaproteobacteria bacterium CG_4_10_14_0_2_um_filter_38_22]PJB11342.1 MAG: D-glycero-beta-D-manno-heptose-1,7-bisphosphate 7-phosphatase [Gammaproteobacteria bacterium CG_4_9_14_3_um_filter_38_9]
MFFVLDRDGVINIDSPDYIKSADEWIPIPGSIEALVLLVKAGHSIVIATNQSGLNRGLFSLHDLDHIHQKMLKMISRAGGKIERIYFCPHRPDEGCDCRKPKTGLFEKMKQDFKLNLAEVIYIGDSQKDVDVAKAVGCQFVLVKTGNGEKTLATIGNNPDLLVFDDLLAAVTYLLK